MKTILVAVVLGLAACGGTAEEASLAEASPAAQTAATHWTFDSLAVHGTADVVKGPYVGCATLHADGSSGPCDDLLALSGTANVGGMTGTVTGNEVPSNGIFGIDINVSDGTTSKRFHINATETGTAFRGFIAGSAGNEEVTGTSP